MDNYTHANRELWNDLTEINAGSQMYDVPGFRAGRSTLDQIDREEVGDVAGKSLLHLQCHFGLDTLSWARLGARVTGVDFSDKAIALAQSLSRELGIAASFVGSDIYDLPNVLHGEFDIVFTSGGVLCWLRDMPEWGRIVARYLKSGGTFYLRDFHPFLSVFHNGRDAPGLDVRYSYFHSPVPMKWEPEGAYADKTKSTQHPSHEWTHSMSDIVNSLVAAGLRIEFLHESPIAATTTSISWKGALTGVGA